MAADPGRELAALLHPYRQARLRLLARLHRPESFRDPLAEFSEALVSELLGGKLAGSPVQKDWDLALEDDRRVQVKYLANSSKGGGWVNEHEVLVAPGVAAYALVLFIDLLPEAVLLFPSDLTAVCVRLGKRHPRQDCTLQLTRRNYERIRAEAGVFEELGVRVLDLGSLFTIEDQGLHQQA